MIRRSILLVVVGLGLFLGRGVLPAQAAKEPSAEEEKAIRRTRELLSEGRASFKAVDVPFGKLLETLARDQPEGKKLAFRIEADAFGKDLARVSDAPIRLPVMKNVSLGTVLRLAMKQVPIPLDYRLGVNEFIITTPARALYSVTYDVRDVVADLDPHAGANIVDMLANHKERPRSQTERVSAIVRLIVTVVAPESWIAERAVHGTIRVENQTRLVIRANAAHHAEIAELFDSLRRLSDVRVKLDTRLFSVDQATYDRVKKAKRPTRAELEEMEERAPKAPGEAPEEDTIGESLRKLTPIARASDIELTTGVEAVFLSQYRVVVAPPLIRGKTPAGLEGQSYLTEPQAVLEGVSFTATPVVSADRRFVHLIIQERNSEVDQLPKPLPEPKKPAGPDIQEQVVELLDMLRRAAPLKPVLSESRYTSEADIADGGSLVMAVHVRPRALEKDQRWLVLLISPRIVIQEEERSERETALRSALPSLLGDVLTNARLKGVRSIYGTADDKRFALVPSARWTPAAEPATVAEHRLTPVARKGNRLLGIRIEDFQWIGKDHGDLAITLTLMNAGGSDNGAAPGACRLRYVTHVQEKQTTVKLLED